MSECYDIDTILVLYYLLFLRISEHLKPTHCEQRKAPKRSKFVGSFINK